MDKLNPDALATCGIDDLDSRAGVQEVTADMIERHVREARELPLLESARAFADWLHVEWNNFNEDGELTNGAVISGALEEWRGGK